LKEDFVKYLPVVCVALTVVAVFTAIRTTAIADQNDRASDEKAIRNLVEANYKAFNDHDAKAFSKLFHGDADFTNVIGWTAKGREEIEAFHKPYFAETRTPGQPSFRNVLLKAAGGPVIRFLRADVATVDFRWAMTGAINPEGKDWGDRVGLMMWVATKEDGTWGIASMHNMDLRGDLPKDTPKELRKK
jgi:uncharacterized protein (TIGR02246 family)